MPESARESWRRSFVDVRFQLSPDLPRSCSYRVRGADRPLLLGLIYLVPLSINSSPGYSSASTTTSGAGSGASRHRSTVTVLGADARRVVATQLMIPQRAHRAAGVHVIYAVASLAAVDAIRAVRLLGAGPPPLRLPRGRADRRDALAQVVLVDAVPGGAAHLRRRHPARRAPRRLRLRPHPARALGQARVGHDALVDLRGLARRRRRRCRRRRRRRRLRARRAAGDAEAAAAAAAFAADVGAALTGPGGAAAAERRGVAGSRSTRR